MPWVISKKNTRTVSEGEGVLFTNDKQKPRLVGNSPDGEALCVCRVKTEVAYECKRMLEISALKHKLESAL